MHSTMTAQTLAQCLQGQTDRSPPLASSAGLVSHYWQGVLPRCSHLHKHWGHYYAHLLEVAATSGPYDLPQGLPLLGMQTLYPEAVDLAPLWQQHLVVAKHLLHAQTTQARAADMLQALTIYDNDTDYRQAAMMAEVAAHCASDLWLDLQPPGMTGAIQQLRQLLADLHTHIAHLDADLYPGTVGGLATKYAAAQQTGGGQLLPSLQYRHSLLGDLLLVRRSAQQQLDQLTQYAYAYLQGVPTDG